MPQPTGVATTTGRAYVLIATPSAARGSVWAGLSGDNPHQVVTVRDGEEAREVIERRGAPAVLLVDLSLPRLDGFSLIRFLRTQARGDETVVVAASAYERLRNAAAELRDPLQISHVLPLDVESATLREMIATALRPAPPTLAPRPASPVAAATGSVQETLGRAVLDAAFLFRVPACVAVVTARGEERVAAFVSGGEFSLPAVHAIDKFFLREIADSQEPLLVPDLQQHPLLNASWRDVPDIRGFAGVPIAAQSGMTGALCLLDTAPLEMTALELDNVIDFCTRLAGNFDAILNPRSATGTATPDALQHLEHLAITDPLTSLMNRRGGERSIDTEIARARRHQTMLSCILIDLDRFKQINDSLGHHAGDQVLREVAGLLRRTVRAYDTVIRWGGEEFLLVLPGAGLEATQRLAERIRIAVEQLNIPGVTPVTISAGAATLGQDYDFETMLQNADRRLYQAKAAGRNCVA